jgi:hypothetical protein
MPSLQNLLPTLLIVAVLIGIGFCSDAIRRWRLKKFAHAHGYTLTATIDTHVAPFSTDVFRKIIWPSYHAYSVATVMTGTIEGIAFTYFEQGMQLTSKFRPGRGGRGAYWHSIIAIEFPASESFQCDADDYWSLEVKREGNWVYFLWDKRHVIPVRTLKKFFAEFISIAKPNFAKVSV